MISEKFSQQIFSVLRKVLREQLLIWTEIVTKELDALLMIYQKYFQNLEKLSQSNSPFFLLVKELENGMIDLLKWINNISDIPNKLSKAGMWAKWLEESNKIIAEISESLDLEVAESFWQTSSSDSLKIRLWKWKNRQQSGLIARGYQILNWLRWLLRKAKKFPNKKVRRVYPRQFIEMFLQIPASEIIIQQWQAFLLRTAKTLFEIHLDSERIKDNLLFMNNILSMCRPSDLNKLSEYFSQIENGRQKILVFNQELKESLLGNFTQVSEEWQKLFSSAENKWLYAGTFILPTKAYNRSKRESAWKVIENRFSDFKSAWLLHYDGEKNEWLKDLELSLLQIKTTLACQNTLDAIETKITKNYLPPLEKAKQVVKSSLEKFTSIELHSPQELENTIIQENKNLLTVMRKDSLPEIMDGILEANLEGSLQAYLYQSKEALVSLSDRHVVFRFRDLHNTPPRSKVNEISLEELIKDDFFKELNQNQEKLLTEIHSRLEHTLRDISEIDQIIEFNLEAALNLLKEGKENAQEETHKIVIQGLQRTFNQINDLVESSLQIHTLCQEELSKITSNFENKVQDLADSEKIFELKLRVAKAKTREEFRNNVKRVWQFAKHFLPLISQFVYTRFQDISNYYRRLRKITGLSPQTIRIEEELTKFLTETQLRIKALPYVYQRLFRLEPLEDERFFAGRDLELEKLKEQISKWENGNYAATALVGERGSGKTTLLKFTEQGYYSGYPLIKYDLTRTTYHEEGLLKKLTEILKIKNVKDFDELKDQILGFNDKRIVILENIQNMFLRVIDGFQGIERFLLLVSQTNSHIYWMTTCTLYSWQYLDKILGISKYFQDVIILGDLPEEEVKTIILKRHRVSGFEISYPEPEGISQTRKYKKLDSPQKRQDYLQNLFFKDLNELSKGNISVAMLFWQRSIQEVLSDKLVVYPQIKIDFSFLYQLSYEELFTLAAFMQHEILTEEQHAKIFHQNIKKSALIFNRLRNNGIILIHPNGFYIHPFLYRAIISTLKSKNILH